MESEYCIFTIAVAVVVIIVLVSLMILVRDVIRYVYRKTQVPGQSRQEPSRRRDEEEIL